MVEQESIKPYYKNIVGTMPFKGSFEGEMAMDNLFGD